jgi:hypothetical protein
MAGSAAMTKNVVPFPRQHKRASIDLDAVLPAIGITSRQLHLALCAALDSGDGDEARRFVRAWDGVVRAIVELGRELETAREQTLAVYLRHYPAAARRILAGKQPRKRRLAGRPHPLAAAPR